MYGARPLKRAIQRRGPRPAGAAGAAGRVPRRGQHPHRRRRRRAGVLPGRRGVAVDAARGLTRADNQIDGRSDDRQARRTRAAGVRPTASSRRRAASGRDDVVRAGPAAPAGAGPGVLLLRPVRRDPLLQRVPRRWSRRPGHRADARRRPDPRRAQGADGDGKTRPFTTVRVEDPKLVEELEAQRREVHRRGHQPVDRRNPRLGHPAHLPRRRCGASSSAGWAAPKAA